MKFRWLKAFFSGLILWSFLLSSIPVKAQGEIVTSEDISGGSSVFVFRRSAKAPQAKFAPKAKPNRTKEQKAKSREAVKKQIAKAPPRPIKAVVKPRVTPTPTPNGTGKKTPTPTPPPVLTATQKQASAALTAGADTYLKNGNFTEAIRQLREAIKLNPENGLAYAGLSRALTQKADSVYEKEGADLSIAIYEEALKNDPENAYAYAGLGAAYESMEQDNLAFENYEKAISFDPDISELYTPLGITYYQKGEFAKAEDFLNRAVKAGIDGDQTQFLIGLLRYKNQDYDGAVTALKKAASLNPQLAEAHYYLGEIYDLKKMENESFAEYIKATQINPKYAEAWFDLGVAYFNRERYDDAINAYQKAIQFDNSNFEAYENLADIYRLQAYNIIVKSNNDTTAKRDLYGKAEGSYRTATDLVENHPKNAKAKENRTAMAELYSKYGFVLGRLAKWNSSITALNKAVSYNPDAFDYTNIGWAYYNAAQLDMRVVKDKSSTETQKAASKAQATTKLEQGRTALEKATAMDKNSKAAYMNLGVTQNDLGDFNGAIQSMQRCLELQNDWVPALNELGIAFRGTGNLADAVKNFRRASDLAEKNLSKLKTDIEKFRTTQQLSDGLYNLAITEKERGNDGEAKKAQDRLRKYNPNMANVLEAMFLTNMKNKVDNKIQEKNPLKNLPKFPY